MITVVILDIGMWVDDEDLLPPNVDRVLVLLLDDFDEEKTVEDLRVPTSDLEAEKDAPKEGFFPKITIKTIVHGTITHDTRHSPFFSSGF